MILFIYALWNSLFFASDLEMSVEDNISREGIIVKFIILLLEAVCVCIQKW